jgi:hypothetical protein
MFCYECSKAGNHHEAIGLCHHCSVALCEDHGTAIADPVTKIVPLMREVVLPKEARLLLCGTCLAALQQVRDCVVEVKSPARRGKNTTDYAKA